MSVAAKKKPSLHTAKPSLQKNIRHCIQQSRLRKKIAVTLRAYPALNVFIFVFLSSFTTEAFMTTELAPSIT
jgi:hypothetical protein